MHKVKSAKVIFTSTSFSITDLDHGAWKTAEPIAVGKYWSGETAPTGRHFEVRMLWSYAHLYVRFDAKQAEPLLVSEEPELHSKTLGLWDRDVVEIFIAPDRNEPGKYYEFEAAPNGEWVDLAIDLRAGERLTDAEYRSEMETASRISQGSIVISMKISWTALGRRPEVGDVWLGNLLRCVGCDPGRGYLTWSPTLTEAPNFHVPEHFGEFVFVKD